MEKINVIVVVGPTASGKTKLSIELAKRFDGEIISADSMQIYKQLSIATAKPTEEEKESIPHHIMDFLELDCSFSVADYVSLAKKTIADIVGRGKMPIIVGGTGLYINSLLDNVSFSEEEKDDTLRQKLYNIAKAGGEEKLHNYLCEIDPEAGATIHKNNVIRVVRAIEVFEMTGKTFTETKKLNKQVSSPYNAFIVGLNYKDRENLYSRINKRVDIMLEQGLLDETYDVFLKGVSQTAFNAIGYKELVPYFKKEASLELCLDKIKQESRRYAKRQLTWFRRDERISWYYVDEYDEFDNIIKKSAKDIEIYFKMC